MLSKDMSDSIHSAIVAQAIASLRAYDTEARRVAELEERTEISHHRSGGYYPVPAVQGYRALAEAYYALNYCKLVPTQREGIEHCLRAMEMLLTGSDHTKRGALSQQEKDKITRQKLHELVEHGETYLMAGYQRHFNIVRIKGSRQSGYSYTVYDAGGETTPSGRNDNSVVYATIEREIPDPAAIPLLIDMTIQKIKTSNGSRDYQDLRREIDKRLGHITRAEETVRQRKHNCTTRAQRLLIYDLLGSEMLYQFITNPENSAEAILDQLEQKQITLLSAHSSPTPQDNPNAVISSAYWEFGPLGDTATFYAIDDTDRQRMIKALQAKSFNRFEKGEDVNGLYVTVMGSNNVNRLRSLYDPSHPTPRNAVSGQGAKPMGASLCAGTALSPNR